MLKPRKVETRQAQHDMSVLQNPVISAIKFFVNRLDPLKKATTQANFIVTLMAFGLNNWICTSYFYSESSGQIEPPDMGVVDVLKRISIITHECKNFVKLIHKKSLLY